MTMQNWLGLSRSHLIQIDEHHALHRDVLSPFLALQSQAKASDIDLQLFSSYRDFDKQLSIWNRKWNGQLPILSADNQPLYTERLSNTDKMHAIMRWSALPGASRHHWGTDIDVYDKAAVEACDQGFQLIDEEYSESGPCGRLSRWLNVNAEHYGFYRPYAKYTGGIGAEPWHISFRSTADNISSQYEKQQLLALINISDIAGKPTILQHFDEIYYRYVLNHGIPTL